MSLEEEGGGGRGVGDGGTEMKMLTDGQTDRVLGKVCRPAAKEMRQRSL